MKSSRFRLAGLAVMLAFGGNGVLKVDAISVDDFSLEDLLNIKVISASKHEQNLYDTAAAVFVLDNNDIRRSGATSVADALRLVPGLTVNSVNSSQWAITSRGFNGLYSNMLLVMMDGRSVYNPLFSGVFWDLQATILDDLDRIEVVRGPGATMWGANAVNGVINIVSRSARDTQGSLIYAGAGNVQEWLGGLRYGGRIGEDTWYRVFASYQQKGDYRWAQISPDFGAFDPEDFGFEDWGSPRAGGPTGDGWNTWHGGFRVDHYPDRLSQLTLQGNVTLHDQFFSMSKSHNINLLTRWNREFSERSEFQLQAYADRTHRDDALGSDNSMESFDIEGHVRTRWQEKNDLTWGLGYRHTQYQLDRVWQYFEILEGRQSLQIFSGFVQNEFRWIPDRLTVTTGIKIEHHDFDGIEVQPSLRVLWEPAERHTLWAAASRAVRTPSLIEGTNLLSASGAPIENPIDGRLYKNTLYGNTETRPEILQAYELGYRYRPHPRIHFDLALFYNRYNRIITAAVTDAYFVYPYTQIDMKFVNGLRGNTYGGELLVTASPMDYWQISAAYSHLQIDLDENDPVNTFNVVSEGSPKHQYILRSAHDLGTRTQFNIQLRHLSRYKGVSTHTALDMRIAYQWSDSAEIALVGQNLLRDQQPEQSGQLSFANNEVPRGFYAKITMQF